jgi:hypothetical protein
MLKHIHDYFFPHSRNNYRPHLFSAASVAVLVLAVILFEAAYFVQTKFVFLETDFLASVLPGALVALTNEDRAALGLAGVAEDPLLNKAAQAAAEDMAAKGYFAHVSPDGKTPWYWLEQSGYAYSYAGQNLAVNFTDSMDVEMAWMESPTHRANIAKREYTRVGFGTANGVFEGQETTFVVEFFATPAPKKVAVAEPIRPAPQEVTAPVQVLGTQAEPVVPPAPASPGFFSRLLAPLEIRFLTGLASPLSTLMAIFTALFAVIAMSFSIAMLVRGRAQHRSVVLGGALLLALIPAAMLVNALVAGPAQLPAEAASAVSALP